MNAVTIHRIDDPLNERFRTDSAMTPTRHKGRPKW